MIAVGIEQDLGLTGDGPNESDRPSIGIRGSEREAPFGHFEALGQVVRNPLGIFCRKHRCKSTLVPYALDDAVNHDRV